MSTTSSVNSLDPLCASVDKMQLQCSACSAPHATPTPRVLPDYYCGEQHLISIYAAGGHTRLSGSLSSLKSLSSLSSHGHQHFVFRSSILSAFSKVTHLAVPIGEVGVRTRSGRAEEEVSYA